MNLQKYAGWLTLALIALVCGLGWFAQSRLILNSDVSWLMLATQRLIAGGTYTKDFFEVNPPVILYLYAPALILIKAFGLSISTSVKSYIFGLGAFILGCCDVLNNKIFGSQQPAVKILFLFVLALVFLVLPVNEFGQREHFMVMLILPYVLLLASRLQQHTCSRSFAILIGCLAGLGFIIKPYFVPTLVLLEIFYFSSTRRVPLRPEIFGIVAVILAMAANIVFFNQDYLTTIIPIATRFYYQKYSQPWLFMLTSPQAIYAYFALFFYLIRYPYNTQKTLSSLLAVTVVGFFIAYIDQQTLWYYHTLPLVAASTILFGLLYSLLVNQKNISRKEYISVVGFTLVLGIYFLIHLQNVMVTLRYTPAVFFGFFISLFAIILALVSSPSRILLALTAILLAALSFYAYLLHSPLQVHILLLTASLMLLLFLLALPQRSARTKAPFAVLMVAGLVVFAYPVFQSGYIYHYAYSFKENYRTLVSAMQPYQNKSVVYFSNMDEAIFPQIQYSQQNLATRFGVMIWVPALKYHDMQQRYQQEYAKQAQNMDFFMNALAEDLRDRHPDVVFVDIRNTDDNKSKRYYGSQQIDYVRFFKLNKTFATAWQPFHYVKTIEGQPLFKFAVYER